MSLESPHLVLLHALGDRHVAGVAGNVYSQKTIKVSVLILFIEVALPVAGFLKVQSSPSALGASPLASFHLTRPCALVFYFLSLAGAELVAAPLLVLFGKDLVAALTVSIIIRTSMPTRLYNCPRQKICRGSGRKAEQLRLCSSDICLERNIFVEIIKMIPIF